MKKNNAFLVFHLSNSKPMCFVSPTPTPPRVFKFVVFVSDIPVRDGDVQPSQTSFFLYSGTKNRLTLAAHINDTDLYIS